MHLKPVLHLIGLLFTWLELRLTESWSESKNDSNGEVAWTPRQNVYACVRLSISGHFFSHTFRSDKGGNSYIPWCFATYELQTSFSALVQPDNHVVQKFDTRKIYQLSNEVIFSPPFLSVSPFLLLNLARRQSYAYAIGLYTRPEIKS